MFGSYSSYSSMSMNSVNMSASAIDISASTAGSTLCAFPSWPRRSCLDDHNTQASSFLSDEDLFLDDMDASSYSAHSSRSSSNASSISPPAWRQQPAFLAPVEQPTEEELEMQRQRHAHQQAYQRELVRSVLKEKESRKQARRQRRAAAGPSTKKSNKLTAIAEAI